MKKLQVLFTAISISIGAQTALAAKGVIDSVIAVVNDNVITQQDLEDRTKLTLRHMGINRLPREEEILFKSRTLNELINEELQLQYAEKTDLKAQPNEINMAIETIEQNNRLPQGAFYKISHGLEKSAKQQVKAEVLWQKIIQRRVRPRVDITNAELDLLIKNLMGEDIVEKEIHQIFISAENSRAESDLKKRVYEIYKRLKASPESFRTIAQTTSEINAAEGGYLGWFGPGELSSTLDEALKKVAKNEISEPVRSQAGWHILKVSDERTSQKLETAPITETNIVRFTRTLSEDKYKRKQQIKNFKKETKSLKRLSQIEGLILKHEQDEAYIASYDMGWKNKEELPQSYITAISGLEKGDFSEIIEDEKRITILYYGGDRERLPVALRNYREKVKSRLITSRIDLNARRFMRDLRRKAYVDIRL